MQTMPATNGRECLTQPNFGEVRTFTFDRNFPMVESKCSDMHRVTVILQFDKNFRRMWFQLFAK